MAGYRTEYIFFTIWILLFTRFKTIYDFLCFWYNQHTGGFAGFLDIFKVYAWEISFGIIAFFKRIVNIYLYLADNCIFQRQETIQFVFFPKTSFLLVYSALFFVGVFCVSRY